MTVRYSEQYSRKAQGWLEEVEEGLGHVVLAQDFPEFLTLEAYADLD